MPSGLRGVEATSEGEKKKNTTAEERKIGGERRPDFESRIYPPTGFPLRMAPRVALLEEKNSNAFSPPESMNRKLFRGKETGDRALDSKIPRREEEGALFSKGSKIGPSTASVTLLAASPSTACVI